jgi:hypothetical protein
MWAPTPVPTEADTLSKVKALCSNPRNTRELAAVLCLGNNEPGACERAVKYGIDTFSVSTLERDIEEADVQKYVDYVFSTDARYTQIHQAVIYLHASRHMNKEITVMVEGRACWRGVLDLPHSHKWSYVSSLRSVRIQRVPCKKKKTQREPTARERPPKWCKTINSVFGRQTPEEPKEHPPNTVPGKGLHVGPRVRQLGKSCGAYEIILDVNGCNPDAAVYVSEWPTLDTAQALFSEASNQATRGVQVIALSTIHERTCRFPYWDVLQTETAGRCAALHHTVPRQKPFEADSHLQTALRQALVALGEGDAVIIHCDDGHSRSSLLAVAVVCVVWDTTASKAGSIVVRGHLGRTGRQCKFPAHAAQRRQVNNLDMLCLQTNVCGADKRS